MSRGDPQINIRVPADVKRFVEREARINGSSRNSEIVRAIRAAMKAKGPAATAIAPDHDQDHTTRMENGDDA